MSWNGAESLALAILDDINNEAVPRWARVRITTRTHGGLHHQVTVEDHQPRWRPTWVGAPVAE
jgi:NADPH-dependent 7-cyano-7-deazaguanine reductase QueF